MGYGGVNQLHTESRGDFNYEKVNEETPDTNALMCHLTLLFRVDATNERYVKIFSHCI